MWPGNANDDDDQHPFKSTAEVTAGEWTIIIYWVLELVQNSEETGNRQSDCVVVPIRGRTMLLKGR